MASSETNSFEEPTTSTTRENMPLETSESNIDMTQELEMETQKEITQTEVLDQERLLANARQRNNSYRGVRLSECSEDVEDQEDPEDCWWSEVENNDLLLDQIPNVTSVFTPSPESLLEKSISAEESESVLKEENFERLHQIADRIKMTLSEHAKNKEIEEQAEKAERERKLSETENKENKSVETLTEDLNTNIGKELTLEEFKEELRTKRMQRQNAVQDLRDEIASLRRQLDLEREVNKRLRKGEKVEENSLTSNLKTSSSSQEGACAVDLESEPSSRNRHANIELANAQLALQMAQSENISLRGELQVVQKQVVTLKEVIACCKQMLAVKEEQCNEIFR